MQGYIFCLNDTEVKDLSRCGGYPYAQSQRKRWKSFSFEESSIDLAVQAEPRFVVEGVVYHAHRQYFIQEGSETIRLMTLHKYFTDCETVKLDADGNIIKEDET